MYGIVLHFFTDLKKMITNIYYLNITVGAVLVVLFVLRDFCFCTFIHLHVYDGVSIQI